MEKSSVVANYSVVRLGTENDKQEFAEVIKQEERRMKKVTLVLAVLVLFGMFFVHASGESIDNGCNHEENRAFFGLDDTLVHKNFCEMSGLYVEVLDDIAMAEGWYYYYTDTDESPAHTIVWEPSDGNYTTTEVIFTVKNISSTPQTYGDKVTATLISQENSDAEVICYEGTVFQQNPGQIDENGNMIMWSTKPVKIAVGESANVSFRFDIPKDFYEKLYATVTGVDTGINITCEFSLGDETIYMINLNDSLIPASQYEL